MLRRMSLSGLTSAALVIATLAASPAMAKDRHAAPMPRAYQGPIYYPPMMGAPWPTTIMAQPYAYPQQPYPQQVYPQPAYPQQAYQQPDPRWAEMEERCRKVYGDKGIGGALIGGLVGGVLGNRIAGGNRTLGTVAGAAVGAIAGTVIDKSEDRELRRECDDYARSAQVQGAPVYGTQGGYAPNGYMMVPVMMAPQEPCVETTVVTERWVDAPVRRRSAPRRTPAMKVKRIKDKRVYTG